MDDACAQALERQSRKDQSSAEHDAAGGEPKKVSMERLTLNHVWKQKLIPVVLRRTGRGEKLRVRLPFADDNRQWLQGRCARLRPVPARLVPSQPCPCRSWSPCPARLGPDG
jgi:hypothetical protein